MYQRKIPYNVDGSISAEPFRELLKSTQKEDTSRAAQVLKGPLLPYSRESGFLAMEGAKM